MNKTKFLALFAISATFFACGSDNGSPAELKNSGQIMYISPFDTLVAEFDSKIVDIDKLDLIINQDMTTLIQNGQTSSNKLYFIGTETLDNGLKHFKENRDDSIVFLNIKNQDGYVNKRTVLNFSTYPIFDGPNNDESNPDDLEDYFGKLSLAKGVTFAGSIGIDPKDESLYDLSDFFKLSLKAYDTLHVKLSNTRDTSVSLGLILPYKNGDTTIIATKNNDNTKSILYGIDPRNFDVQDFSTTIQLKIRVYSRADLAPYLLNVKVVEY